MITPFSIRDSRQLRAFTGLTEEQLEKLEKTFEEVYEEERKQIYEEAVRKGERKRKPGGGRKGKLPTMKLKILFLLFYLKEYPTFDILGGMFGLARSKAHKNMHKLMPILYKTLENMEVVPRRDFENVEEMREALTDTDMDKIIIDATERPHHRPKDSEKQRSLYSGKKKCHTLKNTIITSIDKFVLFLGRTFPGHKHDYTMLKEEFPPEFPWFEGLGVFADSGYQGIQKDYKGDNILIPYKKPKKSKANPAPELTETQKDHNRALSKVRIFVENAIGGIKRYNILNHVFRNRKANFDDDVIAICAGLWNFTISF